MSILLQVGQCGIQIGQALEKVLEKEQDCATRNLVQLAVDTELKTISARRRDHSDKKRPRIRLETVLARPENGAVGRGNNWAFGYQDAKLAEETIEMYRRSVERLDTYYGCLMLHSLAGGSGSGFGSRLLEILRDEYPKDYLMTTSVLPMDGGEVPLQNYNTTLALSYLTQYSDGSALISNDRILRFQTDKTTGACTLNTINSTIASSLTGLMLPISVGCLPPSSTPISSSFNAWNLLTCLSPIPKMPYFSLCGTCVSTTWDAALNDLKKQVDVFTPSCFVSCMSSQLYIRPIGKLSTSTVPSLMSLRKSLDTRVKFVKWNEGALDVVLHASPISFTSFSSSKGSLKSTLKSPVTVSNVNLSSVKKAPSNNARSNPLASMTFAYNSTSTVIPFVPELISKVYSMKQKRAYFHWYDKYFNSSTNKDTLHWIEEALESAEGVCGAYLQYT